MNIGYVSKKSYVKKTQDGDVTVPFYEMMIDVPLGSRLKCTMSKVKEKTNDNSPDYELWKNIPSRDEQFPNQKIGALWLKTSESGTTYLSGHFETPLAEKGRVYVSVFKYDVTNDRFKNIMYSVLWNSEAEREASRRNNGGQQQQNGYAEPNESHGQPQQQQQAYGVPEQNQQAGNQARQMPEAIPAIDIDEDEIPF